MKNDPLNSPLTWEEQQFAIDNHYLISKYLNIRKLPFDDWYDIVIFRYLRSVKRWFAIPELHEHSFEIIAFYAMRSAIGGELAKQGRRIQTVSIEEVIPGTDGMTYSDIVTYENLDYIQYEESEGESMKVSYNVELPERKSFRGAWESDEIIAIKAFISGKWKNMCFNYDTPEEAKKRLAAINAYRRTKGYKEVYEAYRNDNCVYIVRLKKKVGGSDAVISTPEAGT